MSELDPPFEEPDLENSVPIDTMEPPPPIELPEPEPPEPPPAMVRYMVYELGTGRILRSGLCPQNMVEHQAQAGEIAVESEDDGIDDSLQYVVDGAIVMRPSLPGFDKTTITADGEDAATMTVPVGSHVEIVAVASGVCEDGIVEITADLPDSYTVRVTDCWPYLDGEFVIEAVEP